VVVGLTSALATFAITTYNTPSSGAAQHVQNSPRGVFNIHLLLTCLKTLNSVRGEFFNRTSGMGVSSGSQKRKAAYDPQRKWGLAPANGSAGPSSSSQVDAEGPTYVVAGHIVAGASGKHDMFLKEKVGREAQARAARKANSRDSDVTLKRLLARDKEGMRAVQEAYEFAEKTKKKHRSAGGKVVGKEADAGDDESESSGTDDEENSESGDGFSADRPRPTTTTKNAYSARVIKDLGFDPTSKSFRGGHGHRREGEDSRNKIYSEVRSVSSIISCAGCSRHAIFFFFLNTVSTA
jgi:minichromosome maintenance protein 10